MPARDGEILATSEHPIIQFKGKTELFQNQFQNVIMTVGNTIKSSKDQGAVKQYTGRLHYAVTMHFRRVNSSSLKKGH